MFTREKLILLSLLSVGVGTRARLEETPQQAEERLDKMRGAVRTLLECVGEDPDREGLLDTPSRYAKALMFFTKGYQSNVEDIGEIYTDPDSFLDWEHIQKASSFVLTSLPAS